MSKANDFKWAINRPLAVFDIEATGINPRNDRIVELAVLRVHPDQTRDRHHWLINPERPIPPETTRIHGISDADVANSPRFRDLANELDALFRGCDIGGYNVLRFDIPMLTEEFSRCGIVFDTEDRRVFDAQRVFHRKVPRDLTAAVQYYCGELHMDAHGAEADALATLKVMEAQLTRYPDLPRDLDALDAYCNPRDPAWTDRAGRLRWQDGEIVINFGRKQGMKLRDLIREEPGFVTWILRSDFPRDTKGIIEACLAGRWPPPPTTDPVMAPPTE